MITIILLAIFPVAFMVFGVYCAIHNWRNGIQVGNER